MSIFRIKKYLLNYHDTITDLEITNNINNYTHHYALKHAVISGWLH